MWPLLLILLCACGAGDKMAGPAVGYYPTANYYPLARGATTVKIWPLGDSLTAGNSGGTPFNAWRKGLYDSIVATPNTMAVTMLGTLTDGTCAQPNHDGHSGYKIAEITAQHAGWRATIGTDPDVIAMMIGTNNLLTDAATAAAAPADYGTLLDSLTTAYPNAVILTSAISFMTNALAGPRQAAYNAAIQLQAQTRINAGKHVVFLSNMDVAVTAAQLDGAGVHPATAAGYVGMTDVWFGGIRPYVQLRP